MPTLKAGGAGILLLAIRFSASAAGGHFDVDDATVLDTGHSQIEIWAVRSPSEGSGLQHVDGAARVGPVELGLNLDRFDDGHVTQTALGPQVKWVSDPLVARLSAGLLWAASRSTRDGRFAGQTVYVPVTLWGGERLQFHVNVGADWLPGEARQRRLVVAAEWANDALSLLAERSLITQVWSSRLGARWNVDATMSIANRSSATRPSYAIGLNREFGQR